jgi:hypothetical protein
LNVTTTEKAEQAGNDTMGISSSNPLARLLDLLPSDTTLIGDVSAMHADGTATVALVQGGGQIRPRNPLGIASGRVFIVGPQITGVAPSLPVVAVEV